MSSHTDAPTIWIPNTITNIAYRVLMVIVSVAFIWRQCRRPVRFIDEEQLTGIILPDIPSSNTQSSPSSKEKTETKTTDERDKLHEPNKASSSTSSLIASQQASISLSSTVVDGSTIVNEPQNTVPTTDSRPVETSRPISCKETWSLRSGEEMTQELHTADASWISDISQTEVLLGVGAWADGTWSDCHFPGEFGASLEDQEA